MGEKQNQPFQLSSFWCAKWSNVWLSVISLPGT